MDPRAGLLHRALTAFQENTSPSRPPLCILRVVNGGRWNQVLVEFKDGSQYYVELSDTALYKLRNYEASATQLKDSSPELADRYAAKALEMVKGTGGDLLEYIRQRGSQWVVLSKAGKVLGTHPSKKAALAQLGAIEVSKARRGASEAEETPRTAQDDTFRGLGRISPGDRVQCVHTGIIGTVQEVTPDSGDSGNDVDITVNWDEPINGFDKTEVHPTEIRKVETVEEDLSSSEALYGFAGWLTTRKRKTVMSASDNAATVAQLVGKFCKTNSLPEPRDKWTDDLVMPKEEYKHYRKGYWTLRRNPECKEKYHMTPTAGVEGGYEHPCGCVHVYKLKAEQPK